MFEKLKEYGLYIILGLVALGALAYAYITTSNQQKGAEIQEANVNAILNSLSKSDKLKKTSTVAEDLLSANGGKTIGKYKIDPSKVSYVIGETYNDVFNNKKMLDISSDLSDINEGQLRTILIAQPATQINGEDINSINLNADKSLSYGENTISQENLNQLANELKGYNVGAIGYGLFNSEKEAEDFRDDYFSSYEIYEIGDTGKYVILTEYNTTGNENNIAKLNTTANVEDLGTGEEQGVEVCNEYICLDANGVTLKALETTTCGQEYEFQGNNYYIACNKNDLRSKISNTYSRNRIQNPDTGEREREIITPKEYNANQVITSKITDMSFLFDEEWEYREGEDRYDCMEHYREGDGIRYFTDAQGVASWDTSNVTSMKSMFKSSSKFLTDDLSKWNVSNVTDMTGMFCGTGLTNMNLNNWNTSNVTNMSYMFAGSKFNGQIDQWNTSNVTNMSEMFSYCTDFNQPIGNWDVSQINGRNMSGFLRGHESFNQDLSNWNLDNLSQDSIGNTFAGTNQISYENYPILTIDITKRIELVNYEIGLLQDLINNGDGNAQLTSSQKTQHLSSLQSIQNEIPGLLNTEHDIYVQRETNMQSLLTEINTLKTSIENDLIQNRYCHNTTQENNGSGVCENAIYLDSNGVTLKAKSFAKGSTWYEYNGKRYFIAENKSQIIGFIDGEGRSNETNNFKTGKTFSSGIWTYRRKSDYYYDTLILTKVTDLSNAFGSRNYRKYGDISHWDVSNVTNFSRLFYGTESDFDGNLYYWNTSSATDMSYMFAGARCLTSSGYTGCSAFQAQGINNWNVSNVTNFEGMFQNTRFDIALDQWNTSSATNMRNMFKGSRMTHDIHNWNVSNVTNSTDFDASTSTNWTIDKKPQLEQFSIHDGTGIISLDSNGVTIKASSSAIGGYLYSFQGETYYVAKNSQDDVKSGILIYGADHVIVSKLTNMSSMFRYGYGLRNNGSGLTKVETLRNWDVSNVTNMNRTFEGYSRNYLDLQYWNVDNVTNCSNFNRNNAFTKPNFTRCTP